MSCCCCNLPEVEKTCWTWSLEGGCKVIAVIYFIEGIFLSLSTLAFFPSLHHVTRGPPPPDGNITTNNEIIYRAESHYYYALVITLSIFSFIYILQSVSSLFLLIGLTVKEKTAFIRGFIIANHIFIVEDALEFIMYMLIFCQFMFHGTDRAVQSVDDMPAPTMDDMPDDSYFIADVILAFAALLFSIYSQILVTSHYKQVRRAITGPVQAATDNEEGFVNKYLRF
uniref:Uncharacterized protein n=1 Tax=Cacopsylla melanoneura TaxID=428564 RepID=A0A8D8UKQ8_9HEMI